ncbi:MAG: ArsR family transcriptional regulator [Candidatus Heimdallarchaeota archaeon]|nr:MAG: ArsR family transcriptional regulator [Candidatus Heimdallarchaeota archaeon]
MINDIDLLNIMSPSAQIVYQVLRTREKLTTQQIVSQTRYSIRTIRYALRHLMNAHLIVQIPDIRDARRCYYTINA